MSKIGIMREMLLAGKHTKEELAAGSGVALSTVSVQLGYHLKGEYNINKETVDGVKKYWIVAKTDSDLNKEAEHEGEEPLGNNGEPITPEDRADEDGGDDEPSDEELKEIKETGEDKMPNDAELEALLDE